MTTDTLVIVPPPPFGIRRAGKPHIYLQDHLWWVQHPLLRHAVGFTSLSAAIECAIDLSPRRMLWKPAL